MSDSLPQPAAPTGNRFALVTPDDDSAPVIIVTILSLIFAFLIFAIRILIVKWRRHGIDDGILALAHLVGVGQWTSVFIAQENGLGKALVIVGAAELSRMSKAVFASRPLLMITLALSKISVLLVIRSLFIWERRRKVLLIDISLVVVAIWGIAATLLLSAGCSPDYVLGDDAQCVQHVLRLRIVTIIDVITECVIVALPPFFLHDFQMAWQKKSLVITAFAFRLPVAIVSLSYLLKATYFLETHSTGTAIVPLIVRQEVLQGYSLMSATIPCLKSFVGSFATAGMAYIKESSGGRYDSQTTNSFQMNWLKKGSKNSSAHTEEGRVEETESQRPPSSSGQGEFVTEHIPREVASMRSQGSQQPMIVEEN